VLHSLRLSKKGKVRFLPSMICRNNLYETPGNDFDRDQNATGGAKGL